MIIRQATYEDAVSLADRLREQDRKEIWAAHGEKPEVVLPACLAHSERAWVLELEGEVEALFGVAASAEEGVGHPWLLGSDVLLAHPRLMLCAPKYVLPVMQKMFPVLQNYVDCRNKVSIRWLQHIGFTVSETPTRLGPFAMRFYEFYKEGAVCAQ
ncbi:MAG: hypothetical protein MI717_14575 [Spirochaetales bacterium]|nr:hypothetical protein [Spirochaetales bacterium]